MEGESEGGGGGGEAVEDGVVLSLGEGAYLNDKCLL